MKALTWHGKGDIRCETVPDPKIEHGRDAIIKVTACAICGSDLHLLDGVMPSMEKGDVVGHETMGEVVDVGKDNTKLNVGDRVVVPFTISCGDCFFCLMSQYAACENTNSGRTIKFVRKSPRTIESWSSDATMEEHAITTISDKTLTRKMHVKQKDGKTRDWTEVYDKQG